MNPKIHIIPILRDNYAYLIEGNNRRCIIIDPGEVKPIQNFIEQANLNPFLILNTHHHGDHTAGNNALKNFYNIPVKNLKDGDEIDESGILLKTIETPGHAKGHIVFYCPAASALFSGDTLFSMGCGRLLEGTAEEMFESLQKIKNLPPETLIYCGHEYTQSNCKFALHLSPHDPDIQSRMKEVSEVRSKNLPTIPVTLETELKTNPFLKCKTAAEFAAVRMQKDSF